MRTIPTSLEPGLRWYGQSVTQAEYNRQMANLRATEPAATIPATSERQAWEQALLDLIFGTAIED